MVIQIIIFILAFQTMIFVNLIFATQASQREIFTAKEHYLNLLDFDQIKNLIMHFQKGHHYIFNQMIENYFLLTY